MAGILERENSRSAPASISPIPARGCEVSLHLGLLLSRPPCHSGLHSGAVSLNRPIIPYVLLSEQDGVTNPPAISQATGCGRVVPFKLRKLQLSFITSLLQMNLDPGVICQSHSSPQRRNDKSVPLSIMSLPNTHWDFIEDFFFLI